MIRAIIYDCFGVLTSDRWREFTATLSPDSSRAIREIHRAYDKGHISYQDFRAHASELAGVSSTDIDAIFQKHTGHTKNQQLIDHIAQLKPRYKIGIISNVGTAWIRESFLSSTEQALFDDMVLSFEVGLSKPDQLIYELACQRLGVTPAEAVFVDDLESYCQGAKQAGMQAIQYQSLRQYKTELTALLSNPNN